MGEHPHISEDAARADLLQLILGFQVSQAIHAAAALGIANLLISGRKPIADLALATGTHPDSLYRLMRALASIRIFHEEEERSFSLTAVGHFLRSDVADSCAPMAELMGRPTSWQAWGDLLYAVRTKVPAFNHVHGRGVWEHRALHPEEGEVFDRAMAARTEQIADAVLKACDFGRFVHVVDVGGGDGTLLAKIVAAHPRIRATLFDQPQVVARAQLSHASLGPSSRYQMVAGDFFVNVPEDGDAYLLKWILHDWDDTASVDILRNCRRAMKPGSRLLVIEHIIGPANTSPRGKFTDLNMLVITGGRERTHKEFESLFDRAGLRLQSVTPTSTLLSVIEGTLGEA